MASRCVEIADALKAGFEGAHALGLVSQYLVVTRVWSTVQKTTIQAFQKFDHADIQPNTVRVFIMPMEELAGAEGDTRGFVMYDYPLQVGLAVSLKSLSNADVDPISQVSQELRDYCVKLQEPGLLGIPEGVCEVPVIAFDPDYETLKTDKLYLSIFTVKFHGGRAL